MHYCCLLCLDSGPACWVEDKAGKPIIDASHSVCKYFTGRSGCGWSDRISVKCPKVSLPPEKTVLGPCKIDDSPEYAHLPHCLMEMDINNID